MLCRVYNLIFISLAVLIYNQCLISSASASKCDTCRSIAKKFKEGLEKTSKSNFGGGNTNWEERKLGTYAVSETRLLEILDQCCDKDEKECHYMIEENEESLEEWWFKEFGKNKQDNLFQYFCIDDIKVCCPDNTYGKNCRPCPGGTENPCSGHGQCLGAGEIDGKGVCQCNEGYGGKLCDQCAEGYFIESQNDTNLVCTACHRSCNSTCSGPESSQCDSCAEGWIAKEGEGCVDLDECSNGTKLCADFQYCENTEGSFACNECDIACNGCTGAGSDHCVNCAERYFLNTENRCTACHRSCRTSCTDDSPLTCDLCAPGWIFIAEKGCSDIDECEQARYECDKNTYCLNTDGSYVCKACHETCSDCTGPGPDHCMRCKKGYQRKDDQTECLDVDECVMEEGVCGGVGEKCVNTLGSYKCVCLEDYVMVRGGKCQLKNKNTSKKEKKKKDKSKPSEVPPSAMPSADPLGEKNFEGRLNENLNGFKEALGDLGAPLEGVPIDESIVMEGNFNKKHSRDSSEKSTESGDSKNRYPDEL